METKELEIIMSQKADALHLIQAAKIVMLRNRPFYGALIGSLPLYAEATWLSTAATDGRNIYYNPEFIAGMHPDRKTLVLDRLNASSMDAQSKAKELLRIETFYRRKTMPEVVFILEHELRHVVNSHMSRGKNYIPDLYNIAADHYTNTHLVVEHGKSSNGLRYFPLEKQTTFSHEKEFGFMCYGYADFKYHGWTAEKIYEDLLKNGKTDTQNKVGKHMSDKDGATQSEKDILGYDNPMPQLSEEQIQRNTEITKRQISSAAQAAGDACPEDIRKMVGEFSKPQINYLTLIRKRMVSLISVNRTYRRPHRRSGGMTQVMRNAGFITHHQNMVLPGSEKDKTIDIVLAFDVSGSVTDDLLQRVYKEILGLTTLYKVFRITMFCWSTVVGNVEVYTEKNIRDILNYKVKTTGGTTAACAFKYIEENIPDAKEVIMFTDGYIEDLSKKTKWANDYNTLWVIFNNTSFKQPFGEQVLFDAYTK